MQEKIYNAKGMEVRSPIYYIRTVDENCPYPKVNHRPIPIVENGIEVEANIVKNIIDVSPSKKFGFKVDVDDEGTYDVNIKFNPRRFFGIGSDIYRFVSNHRSRNWFN